MKKILLIILLIFPFISSFSQRNLKNLTFINFSIDDGLSQSSVTQIFQDSRYYMWFATLDGLNKYNGVTFKIYSHEPDNDKTISSKWIYDIVEDKEGYLWVATLNGLNRFDRKTQTFKRFLNDPNNSRSLPENVVKGLYVDENNVLWVRTDNFLSKYVNGEFYSYAIPQKPLTRLNPYTHIPIVETDDILWTTSSKGLIAFYKNTEVQKIYKHKEGDPFSISSDEVTSLAVDGQKNLWIGTNNGLNVMDINSNTFTQIFVKDSTGLLSNKINVLYTDNLGNIWIGTDKGLNVCPLFDNVFQSMDNKYFFRAFVHEDNNPNSLSFNNVTSIYEDFSFNLWVGTYGGGVNKADLKPKKFQIIRNNHTKNSIDLSSNQIAGLLEYTPDVLWIGTYGKGLNILNLKTKKVTHIFADGTTFKSLTNNYVHSIIKLKNGLIFLGTRNGITVYDPAQNKFFDIQDYYPMLDFPQLKNNRIYEMLEDVKHDVWIATNMGLFKFNTNTKEIDAYYLNDGLKSNSIWSLYEDDFGKIWIGTTKGINIYDLFANDNKFHDFSEYLAPDSALKKGEHNKLSNENVYSITQTKKYYWFGTTGGLNRYDPISKKIKYYLKKDGLPNENIYDIVVDNNNNLWFSTNRGLVFLKTSTNLIKSFDKEDGLQDLEFNKGARAKGSDGKIFFGGINGLNYFYPDSIRENLFIPKTSFDEVIIFDKEGKSRTIYVDNKDTITLTPKDKSIKITFSALEFTNPSKNQYKYYLEGMDEKWINAGHQNFVSYTNLEPGDYILHVQGSNNDLKWSLPIRLYIRVKPPFWKTIWAFLLYIIILGGIIFLLIRYRTEKLRKDNELLREKQKAAIEIAKSREELAAKNKDLHDSLSYAKRIQQAIMPTRYLMKKYFPESFVFYHPRDIVSGDFYWFLEKDYKFYVAAVDCTGHGVPGAFMSLIGLNMLHNIVEVDNIDRAGKILDELNKSIYDNLNKEIENVTVQDGMDMSLVVIDLINKQVNFSGAKNPLVLIRNGEYIEIPANKYPIGSFKYDFKTFFNEYDFEIQKGDTIYLFSDGYADQFGGPKGKKFKKKNFRNLLIEISKLPINEQYKKVKQVFYDWKGDLPQVDDILLIGIKLL